jgi:protein-S-isoprenylcysteine O-methyltransferase Ste14
MVSHKFFFLIPLLAGFISHIASSFTAGFSEKYGSGKGTFITIVLRDILGIPLWATGFLLAIKNSNDLLFLSSMMSNLAGWTIIAAGGILIITALVNIKTKAAAPSVSDSLVQSGIYSIVRHPIHLGTLLEFAGIFILWPTLQTGIAFFIGIIWIVFQTRFEEKDLLKRIPEYKDYMEKVSGFFPAGIFKNLDN